MKKIKIALLFFVIFSLQATYTFAQGCDCEKELDWVIDTFEKNDAGFQYVVDQKGTDDYKRFTEGIFTKSRQTKDIKTCEKIIDEWLKYFRKGHLFASTFNDDLWSFVSDFAPSGYEPIMLKEDKADEMQMTDEKPKRKDPYLKPLNDKTLYLYIPSFEIKYKNRIDSVLDANEALLKQAPNLIIDLRDSRGGSDDSYRKIIPYLYTNPIHSIGLEIKATELNKEGFKNYAKMNEASGNTYMKSVCEETVKDIENNMGNFFNPNTEVITIDSSYTKLPYPQKVGIICDRKNGSSDEEFLIMAKQSFKVKIFGRMTYGSLDMSNMNFAFSPSRLLCLGYAMSKSYRIPDFCIDNIGLQPDYFINRDVTDWVKFTQDILEY